MWPQPPILAVAPSGDWPKQQEPVPLSTSTRVTGLRWVSAARAVSRSLVAWMAAFGQARVAARRSRSLSAEVRAPAMPMATALGLGNCSAICRRRPANCESPSSRRLAGPTSARATWPPCSCSATVWVAPHSMPSSPGTGQSSSNPAGATSIWAATSAGMEQAFIVPCLAIETQTAVISPVAASSRWAPLILLIRNL